MPDPEDDYQERREFARRPRSTQATIFFGILVLAVAVIYSISQSVVGTPPQYGAGPLPEVQERWQLTVPVNTSEIRVEGADGPGTTVWTLSYEGVGAGELLRSTRGPGGHGAPLTAALVECGTVEIYLEAAESALDCEDDLRGLKTAVTRQDSSALWVFWADGAIHLVQYLDG